jgi:DNA-binding transcriptional ArsR family regulator
MGEEQAVLGGRRRTPDVFTVIGDPTKRKILEMTRDREWCVNELVESLEISQPAISKHLRSLREAGLVQVRVDGQRRWYRLRDEQMGPLQDWIRGFSTNGAATLVAAPAE